MGSKQKQKQKQKQKRDMSVACCNPFVAAVLSGRDFSFDLA